MFGVMRETLESDGGSMSGDDDFFSVARTMPFVAVRVSNDPWVSFWHDCTFYSQRGNSLVYSI